jgi:hypothetical protein
MTLTSRRQPPPEHPDTVAQQSWEAARRTIARFLRWSKDNWSGIPGGFPGTTPTTIEPDATGDAGTEEASWAAADHEHPIATATAASLGSSASEGTATSFSRSDHVHPRAIETANGGYVRGRLNFKSGFTVSDDSSGNEIEVEVSSAVVSGGPRSARPDANDYILHRVTHLESYIVAIQTGKI